MIATLATRWGQWSPPMITRFVLSAIRLLHPPADPSPGRDEADAHSTRDLSFALLGDTVILSGTLPRLEGEAVIAAIDALADRLRSTAEHIPAGARRADALVELVNTAAATGTLPTRGGLPSRADRHPGPHHPRRPGLGHQPRTPAHPRRTTIHRLRPHDHPDRRHHPATITGPRPPVPRHPRSPVRHPPPTAAREHAARRKHARSRSGPHPGGPDRGPGRPDVRRPPDPAGRRTDLPDRHPRPTTRPGHPRRWLHHPRMPDPGRELPSPPRPRLGRRRGIRPAESGPALLGPPPPSRPRHVDHHPHRPQHPRAPTPPRSTTRHPLARQPQRTLDHHPNPTHTMAAVRLLWVAPGLGWLG